MYAAGQSQTEIASELQCHPSCIEDWFIRFNIPRRSTSESGAIRARRSVILTETEREVLIGLMLSDGHLDRTACQARVSIGFKHLQTIQSVITALPSLEWGPVSWGQQSGCWYVKCHASIDLVPWHDTWYGKGRKEVPRLALTPTSCYWWFIGDGRRHRYNAEFCTDGFSLASHHRLILALLHLGLNVTYRRKSGRLWLSSCDTKRFLKMIGPCQNPEYDYKWAWRPRI
jgi:hypothetical protein